MSNSSVGFGLIGFGAWGTHHAAAIARTANAKLVAIAARSEATCRQAHEAYPRAAIYPDYRALLEREDVDVVDVVVPSYLHFEIASRALALKRHLLLEKPMGLDVKQCDELIRLSKRHGGLLAVGHELRFSSLWGKVKAMVDSGFVGDPQYLLVELSRKPYRSGAGGWRFDLERVGDWIMEEPIHFFDLARWYLEKAGSPLDVYAAANSRRADRPRLQDNVSAIVHFSGGAYAVVTQTLCAFEHHQTVKLSGTQGALWASWSGAMDRTRRPVFFLKAYDGVRVEEVHIDRTAGEVFELEEQIAMMVRAVSGGSGLAVNGRDGRWSVAMCLAAKRSIELGRRVGMDEVFSGGQARVG